MRLGASSGASRIPPRPSGGWGGPQMAELSRDGRRVHVTGSLAGVWDGLFSQGVGAWVARRDADPAGGGIAVAPRLFPTGWFPGLRVHQTRLQGGEAPATPTATRW